MKKNIIIASKYFFLLIIMLLITVIFRSKIQYAIFGQYVFERPHAGQMKSGAYDGEQEVVISDQSVLIDGVYTEYEVVNKEWGIHDLEFRDEYGELLFRTIGYTISSVEFHSNINRMAMAGVSGPMVSNPAGGEESISNDDRITSQLQQRLMSAVFVNLRYQVLYRQLRILACLLIPCIFIGSLIYFKPTVLKRFLKEKSSYPNQFPERNIRIFGVGILLVSSLLPFILLYVY